MVAGPWGVAAEKRRRDCRLKDVPPVQRACRWTLRGWPGDGGATSGSGSGGRL